MTIEINVEVSCGELIDKLTILSIKNEKITNEEKLKNIQHEFKVLNEISKNLKSLNPNEFDNFYKKLRKINSKERYMKNLKDKEYIMSKLVYYNRQDLENNQRIRNNMITNLPDYSNHPEANLLHKKIYF